MKATTRRSLAWGGAVLTGTIAIQCGVLAVKAVVNQPAAEAAVIQQAPPPPFVNGAPWVQRVPWDENIYTYCGPLEWRMRVFAAGTPGMRSGTVSVMDVSNRPAGDPLSCPAAR